MRIISGNFKGRRLAGPTWPGLRPTSDRLRETLFNVLRDEVRDARVLDACAGTGALGIEALSRGAAFATFIDIEPRAGRLIEENLRRCGIADRYAIIRAGLAPALARLPAGERFDLILFDPAYDAREVDALLTALAARVTPDGLLVYEHARRRAAPETAGALVRVREIRAGDSVLAFYRRGGEA